MLQRWVEAGKPEGENLTKFMQGRRSGLIVSNQTFEIGATNHFTQFAVIGVRTHGNATLFVTTNQVLIWLNRSGIVEIYQ